MPIPRTLRRLRELMQLFLCLLTVLAKVQTPRRIPDIPTRITTASWPLGWNPSAHLSSIITEYGYGLNQFAFKPPEARISAGYLQRDKRDYQTNLILKCLAPDYFRSNWGFFSSFWHLMMRTGGWWMDYVWEMRLCLRLVVFMQV